MIDFLLGVPGKLKTISDYLAAYLSPTRCAKIDNCDTTTSSRAPASTALSTAVWDAATAAKINSGGIPGTIKSIQRGFANAVAMAGSGEDAKYIDVTISAVDVSKSVVLVQGRVQIVSVSGTYQPLPAIDTGRLTSPTNLRLSAGSDLGTLTGRWTVVEYY